MAGSPSINSRKGFFKASRRMSIELVGAGSMRSSDAPYDNPAAITPSDSVTNVPIDARGLIVLTGGTLVVVHTNELVLAFGALLAGQTIPIAGLQRVNSTGTTATVAAGR